METDTLVTTLQTAGLSPYQADAYVALLDLGTASASEIADHSGVPLPRIYDVLRGLERERYVETYEQGPLKARAHDPGAVLSDLRTRADRFEDAADEVEQRWQRPELEHNHASIVKRFETVIDRAQAFISSAERQIQLSVSLEDFETLRPALEAAHDRGVFVRVSVHTHPEAAPPSMARFEGACTEARHRNLPASFVALIDRTKTCFSHHADSVDQYGVIVDDATHAYVFYWYFLTCLWEHWEPIYSTQDEELPIEYVDIRRCARDIEALLADGATIHAEVDGRTIDTGDPCSYEGTLTNVVYGLGTEKTSTNETNGPSFAGQATLQLDTGEREISIGGWGAVIEEVEANRIIVKDIEHATHEP